MMNVFRIFSQLLHVQDDYVHLSKRKFFVEKNSSSASYGKTDKNIGQSGLFKGVDHDQTATAQ